MKRPETNFLICFLVLVCMASSGLAQHVSGEDVPEAVGWSKVTVASDLEHPWGLAFLPGGDILVTERPGRMRLIRNGELLSESISGVPEVLAAGQGGLLDVAVDPDFVENRLVYFTYASGTQQSNQTTLARGVLNDMQLEDLEVLFKAEPAKSGGQHFGSRILWLEDGTMLVSIGDGGNPPLEIDGILAREHSQRLDTHLGSIIRLNADGSIPRDNPFRNQENAKPEIYSYGVRNIQGLTREPTTNRVWANEHGPFGGDELNLIKAGENYGWPRVSHGRDYRSRQPITEQQTVQGMVDPKIVWTPAQAPSGLAFYSGDHFPHWKGNLFSGGLASKEIRRIILDAEAVTGEEKLSIGKRVREVAQGLDGYLYILTDLPSAELIRIEPQPRAPVN